MGVAKRHQGWRLPSPPCSSPMAPHARATGGWALPLPQGLAEVDRRHIPPLLASHAAFSQGELGADISSWGPRGCAIYTLQGSGSCTLGPAGAGTVLGAALVPVFGCDPFPALLLVYEALPGSSPRIDRSPTPPIRASWALYTRADTSLC